MARDLRNETEYGLPLLPDPFGAPIVEGATGVAAITGLSDADATKAGAVGAEEQLRSMGSELREIYATGEGPLGPTEPPAGTS
jgi:hypothetical protein